MNLNRKLVSKEELLKDVTDIEVYRCYAPTLEIHIGTPTISPLRDESNPSFGLFIGENNQVLFNDFKLGGGDCFKFVQLMFGDTFFEALSRVAIDFDLEDKYICKQVNTRHVPKKESLDKDSLLKKASSSLIRKRRRAWKEHDMKYWKSFGITIEILEKYKVEPVSHIFINTRIIPCDSYTYAFIENKDGVETYKIYQPFNFSYKWINNHDDSVWQGWNQLPDKGKLLIITKSLKDVMTISSLTNIPAVSLQAESITPKSYIIDELKDRFDTIFIWYDNDFDKETNWGKQFGNALAEKFDLIPLFIPDKLKYKDPSDYVAGEGKAKGIDLINKLISLPF